MKKMGIKPGFEILIIGLLLCICFASCSVIGNLASNTNVPAAPTGVKLSAAIDTVTVSWNSVAGATSYTVYDTIDGTTPSASNHADENSPTGTQTTITYTPATPGNLTVVVTATNNNGEGNGSAPQEISTLVPTGVSISTPEYNSSVVTGSGTGAFQVTISWTPVTGASGYYVFHTYGQSPGQPSEQTASSTGPTYQNANPITAASYTFTMGHSDTVGYIFYFGVAAVDINNNTGALSSVVTTTVPALP